MIDSNRLFWSAQATAQFLELETANKKGVDNCVDLIARFPLIGIKLLLGKSIEHRRFVCAGFQVIYELRERDSNIDGDRTSNNEPKSVSFEITVRFIKLL